MDSSAKRVRSWAGAGSEAVKRAHWILAVILALLVLVPLSALFWLQSSIRGLIQDQGRLAFGTATEVGAADLSLWSGRLELSGVRIDNPEGFQSPRFIDVGQIDVSFEPSSLFGQTVKISRIDIRNVEIHLENQRGKFNYRPILDHIRKSASEGGGGGSAGAGKKLTIEKLRVSGVQARLMLGVGGAALGNSTVQVPDQEFENLGSDGGGSMAMQQLMRKIVESLMRGVASQGKGQLTRELLGSLWGRLAGEAPAAEPGKPPIEDVVKDLQDLLKKP